MPYWAEAAGADLRFGVAGVSRGTVGVGFQLSRLALWQRPFKFCRVSEAAASWAGAGSSRMRLWCSGRASHPGSGLATR